LANNVTVIDFSPPNDERIVKKLKLRKNAEKRAKSNHPVSSAVNFDQVEQKVISAFQQDCAKKKQDLLSTMHAAEEAIIAQKAKMFDGSYITEAKVEVADLKHYFKGFKRQYIDKRKLHQEKEEEFKKFRDDRKLLEPPGERPNVFWYSLDLLMLLAVESLLNMYFFKDGNDLGLLGGLIEAFGIAGFNITFWFVIGWWGVKRINSVIWYNRIFGYVFFLFSILAIPVSNLLIGFYRDMLTSNVTLERNDAMQQAWNLLFAMDIKLLSPSSILLVMLGIMMAGWALQKGYKYGHRYPGYSAKYEEFQKSSDSFQELDDELRDQYIVSLAEISAQLSEKIQSIKPQISDISSRIKRVETYITKWDNYLKARCRSVNSLLANYRDMNVRARSDAPPKYFATLYLDEQKLGGDKIIRALGSKKLDLDVQITEIGKQVDRVLKSVLLLEKDINQLLDWENGS